MKWVTKGVHKELEWREMEVIPLRREAHPVWISATVGRVCVRIPHIIFLDILTANQPSHRALTGVSVWVTDAGPFTCTRERQLCK